MSIEDFTTWTTGDPNSRLTVAATSITWDDVHNDDDGTWVYKDYGASYFNSDQVHRFKFTTCAEVDNQNNSKIYCWGLTNSVDEMNDIDVAGGDFWGIAYNEESGGANVFRVEIITNGSANRNPTNQAAASTPYFFHIEIDADGGANNTGQLVVYITTVNYHGDTGAVAFQTITVDEAAGGSFDFRYCFLTNVYGVVTASTDGLVEDFDPAVSAASYVDAAATISVAAAISATAEIATYIDAAASIAAVADISADAIEINTVKGSGGAGNTTVARIVAVGNNSLWYEDK